jgi:hypothetical protein
MCINPVIDLSGFEISSVRKTIEYTDPRQVLFSVRIEPSRANVDWPVWEADSVLSQLAEIVYDNVLGSLPKDEREQATVGQVIESLCSIGHNCTYNDSKADKLFSFRDLKSVTQQRVMGNCVYSFESKDQRVRRTKCMLKVIISPTRQNVSQ